MAPKLSVVVAGSRPGGPPRALFATLAPLLASGEIELILATARREPTAPLQGVRIVKCEAGTTIPALRLAGVRAAAAPVVAVTEDFCAPAARWAEALIDAHGRGAGDVLGGPVARRDGSPADWALTFVEYGRFLRAEPGGPVREVPSVNVAYEARTLADALGPDARELYEVEVHERLRVAGARFWRVPGAVMLDENRRPLGEAVTSQFHHGRFYGGGRVAGRGAGERLLRAALSPVVPFALLARIAREAFAAGLGGRLAIALPALSLLLAAWACGEAVGSLRGRGTSGERWT